MVVVVGKALYGDNLRAIECTDRYRARSHGRAVDMHRAGTALSDSSAELRTGQSDHVAQHPEKRSVGFDIGLSERPR